VPKTADVLAKRHGLWSTPTYMVPVVAMKVCAIDSTRAYCPCTYCTLLRRLDTAGSYCAAPYHSKWAPHTAMLNPNQKKTSKVRRLVATSRDHFCGCNAYFRY